MSRVGRRGLRASWRDLPVGGLVATAVLFVGALTAAVSSVGPDGPETLPEASWAFPEASEGSEDASPRSTKQTGEVPVLLVPGWLDTERDMAALRIRLLGAGWPDDHVLAVGFQEPTGSNRGHADELAAAIDAVLEQTGAAEVDIVAHSMGGLATRWYLRGRPEAPVRRVAFVGSPHRGTLAAHLAWGGGRDEMMPDSPFLDTLNAQAPYPEGVDAITIRTVVDTHIVPGESATLPGVVDHELCCPTHAGLIRDDEVFQIVLEFLDGP